MQIQRLISRKLKFNGIGEAIEHYFYAGWTDGLPVIPPTAEKVEEFLHHTPLGPSEIVGIEPVKGRIVTVEKVVINSVMAGCLPEYLPVVLAATEAMCQRQFNLHAVSVSTMGAAVLTVVNGPITRQLGINSGVNVFGSGCRANATIGRAIRLVISNVTGAVSGILDKATLGHAGKYTWCIAEDEVTSPWDSLSVERGQSGESNSVTVFAGLSPVQVSNHHSNLPKEILLSFRDAMFTAGPQQGEIAILLSPEYIGHMKRAGWSKNQVKSELCKISRRELREWFVGGVMIPDSDRKNLNSMRGVVESQENITLIVAGGPAGAFSSVIPLWGGGSNSKSVTKKIRLSQEV